MQTLSHFLYIFFPSHSREPGKPYISVCFLNEIFKLGSKKSTSYYNTQSN